MTDFVDALDQYSSYEYYEIPDGGHYLLPFSVVAASSHDVLDATGNYASLIKRALSLAPPDCTRCDDISTSWMTANGKKCDDSKWQISKKCVEDDVWVSNGYCRTSCSKAGRGYDGETCCQPSVPPCTECINTRTPWMRSKGKTCEEMGESLMHKKCGDDGPWAINKYCQKSCFEAELGYDDIICCK